MSWYQTHLSVTPADLCSEISTSVNYSYQKKNLKKVSGKSNLIDKSQDELNCNQSRPETSLKVQRARITLQFSNQNFQNQLID